MVWGRSAKVIGDDLAFSDHVAQRPLDAIGDIGMAEVPEHQRARQDEGRWVRLVQAGVLRRRAVDRLEHGRIRPDIRARRDPQPADEPCAQVAHDVPIQVRQDEDVVQVRLLDELHAHVVDDPVLELDLPVVVGGDRPAALEEQPVGQLHDVRLVDRGHLPAVIGDGVVEGVPGDPLGGNSGDDLDALGRVRRDHVLDAGVEILRVLADDHEVDVVVARLQALDRPRRTEICVQAKGLAKGDVDAPEAAPNRGRDRALEGDLVPADRLEDVVRERRAVLGDDGLAGVHRLPFELDSGGV